jgi:hypothetical protein
MATRKTAIVAGLKLGPERKRAMRGSSRASSSIIAYELAICD